MMIFVLLIMLLVTPIAHAAADLQINSFTGQPQAEDGRVELSFTVTNNGPNDATRPGGNLYVYSNKTLLVTRNFTFSSIAVGESREEKLTIDVPDGSITTLQLEIYDSQEPDKQPSTNTAAIHLKPGKAKSVDLQIMEAGVENQLPLSEKSANLRLRLRNNGPDISGFSKLVAELLIYNTAAARNERRVERLGSGEDIEFKMPLNLNQAISGTSGTIQLTWILLDASSVDSSLDNNLYSIPVSVIPRMPDLIPRNITWQRNGKLAFWIQNKGNARSEPTVTALYINGALMQRFQTPQVPATGTRMFAYAAGKVARDTKIEIVVDFNADVEEASEENNRMSFRARGNSK